MSTYLFFGLLTICCYLGSKRLSGWIGEAVYVQGPEPVLLALGIGLLIWPLVVPNVILNWFRK